MQLHGGFFLRDFLALISLLVLLIDGVSTRARSKFYVSIFAVTNLPAQSRGGSSLMAARDPDWQGDSLSL